MKTKLFSLSLLIVSFLCGINEIRAQNTNVQKEPVVAYEIAGMKEAIVKKDIPFLKTADSPLKMDVYYPPGFDFKTSFSAIVFIFGYPNDG